VTDPLVSIVIPCYRQGRFLGDAIRSALGQVGVSLEVIVVNDGSDDDTECVAWQFGNRIRYCRQPNRGLPQARNRGLALATGTYVLCLDADDVLDPRALSWLVTAAAGRADVLCVMGYAHFDDDHPIDPGRVQGLPPPEPLEALEALLTTNLGPPHAFLASRDMLRAIGGFDPTLRACEDWDVWVRLVVAGATLVPVREVGAHYRQHPTSMSRNRVVMTRTRAEVLGRNLQRLRRGRLGGTDEAARALRIAVRQFLAGQCVDAAYWLREHGEYGAAFMHYLRGLYRGGDVRVALMGVCKLGPHRLWRGWRRWHGPAPT
jgi:GT2 family glycosyltransferase